MGRRTLLFDLVTGSATDLAPIPIPDDGTDRTDGMCGTAYTSEGRQVTRFPIKEIKKNVRIFNRFFKVGGGDRRRREASGPGHGRDLHLRRGGRGVDARYVKKPFFAKLCKYQS